MDAREALQLIRGYVAAGRYVIVGHALQRMRERRVSEGDVVSALKAGRSCRPEPHERWKVVGPDLDGEDLAVVVVLEDGVVVVTVF